MWASCLVFLWFIKSIFLVHFFFSGLLLTRFVQKIVIMCECKVIIPEWLFYRTERLMRWGFFPTIFLYLFILKKKTSIGYSDSTFLNLKIEKEMILNWTKTVQYYNSTVGQFRQVYKPPPCNLRWKCLFELVNNALCVALPMKLFA